MKVSGQHHAPADLPPGKEPVSHWIRGYVWPRASLNSQDSSSRSSNPQPCHYTNYESPTAIQMGGNFLYIKLSNLYNTQGSVERWKSVRIRGERRKMPASVESNNTQPLCVALNPSAGWSKWSRSYVMVVKQGCVMHYKLVNCETRIYNYSFIFLIVFYHKTFSIDVTSACNNLQALSLRCQLEQGQSQLWCFNTDRNGAVVMCVIVDMTTILKRILNQYGPGRRH